tara:strand:+ start:483 stop:656 length:174 start_codon:yes stop_codon:yes gene_type:complete
LLKLTKEEIKELSNASSEEVWYKVCDKIKDRRNGQYPSELAREILNLFQQKFSTELS